MRLQLLNKMDGLLAVCKTCEKKSVRSQEPHTITCKGCSVYSDLQEIGNRFERDPAEKFKKILNKGQDMTKSDIAFLLENGVQMKKVQSSLKMPNNTFSDLMINFGFSKKQPNKGVKKVNQVVEEKIVEKVNVPCELTLENYIALKKLKIYKEYEIAEKLGATKKHLANWKWKNKKLIEEALNAHYSANEIISEKKQPTHLDISEYADTINQLSNALEYKDKLIQSLQEKVTQLESIHAACEDVESETANLLDDLNKCLKENEHLKALLKVYL